MTYDDKNVDQMGLPGNGPGEPGNRNRLLTIQELSSWLSVPVPTLYLWVHQRKLPHVKIGRLLRFEKNAIEGCLMKWRVKNANPLGC